MSKEKRTKFKSKQTRIKELAKRKLEIVEHIYIYTYINVYRSAIVLIDIIFNLEYNN